MLPIPSKGEAGLALEPCQDLHSIRHRQQWPYLGKLASIVTPVVLLVDDGVAAGQDSRDSGQRQVREHRFQLIHNDNEQSATPLHKGESGGGL